MLLGLDHLSRSGSALCLFIPAPAQHPVTGQGLMGLLLLQGTPEEEAAWLCVQFNLMEMVDVL